MSHKNKKSLTRQIEETLKSKLAAGQSKHLAKQQNETQGSVFSYSTLKSYMTQCNHFANYCKAEHNAKTLEQCCTYINEYLQHCVDSGQSAYTIKLTSCSLAKLYSTSSTEFMKTPARHRSDIVRSRSDAVRDAHFSPERNSELVNFCRCSGLRRHELQAVRGDALCQLKNGAWALTVKGKGGLVRQSQLMGSKEEIAQVVSLCHASGAGRVFDKIHNACDVHSYRAEYSQRCYNYAARPLETLQKPELYVTRGDMHKVYDKEALRFASKNLGHSRLFVIPAHYSWQVS